MRIAGLLGAGLVTCVLSVVAGGCFNSSSTGSSRDGGLNVGDSSIPIGTEGGSVVPGQDGGGVTGSVTLSTGTIDFGLVDCGSQAATKTYSVQNTGTIGIEWSASASAPFAVQGTSSGTIEPGATGSITLGTTSIPTTSDPGVALTGTLTITTNVPGYKSVQVPLQVTPQGGSLVLTPAVVGFGTAQISTTQGPQAFTLKNVGNAAVGVTLSAPTDPEFAVTYTGSPAGATLAPGGTLAGAGATFTPSSAGAKSATSTIQVTGALCASSATQISLTGTGTAAQVSIGPSPLQFGAVNCGSTAPAQTVTIKNAYTFPLTYTAALGQGSASPYALSSASGSVPASGQATITVTPAAIPVPGNIAAGAYDDQLTITTNAPSASPTVIPLQESAQGAILALAMATTSFGTVQNTTTSLPFTITNTGNVDATVSVGTTGAGYAALLTVNDTAKANGGTAPGDVKFTATTNATVPGTLTVSSTTALCAALPQALALTATAAVPVVSYPQGSPLAVAATCGGGALTTATLTVQNTGNAPLTLSSIASKNGLFTVSPTLGPIAGGASGTITITAAPAPANAQGGAAPSADTLSFASNEPGNHTYTAPVNVSYHGANLVVKMGPAMGGSCSADTSTVTITNTGDMDAVVEPTGPYSSDPPFNFGGAFCGISAAGCIVTAQTLKAGGGSITDNVSANLCSNANPCNLNATETYSTTNPTGGAVGICVATPNVSLSFKAGTMVGSCQSNCCT